MSVNSHKETLGFATETKQLLHLMIHSLYSNKEIFLRELVSNASDACDKLRFESLSDDALFEGDDALDVTIGFDKEANTITISDNGIGMNREEVVANLGTIARSGTRQFLDNMAEGNKDNVANMIGQFGVGFYSSFIIAESVVVESRRAGLTAEHGIRWTSAGEGEYDLETIEKVERGTTVVLHLREGNDEFLDGWRLRSIVRKYSDHITFPIKMMEDVPPTEEEGEEKKIPQLETVNQASALWANPRNEITAEEYNEFYKHVGHDFEDPLAHVHTHVEGKLEYTSLLYIPARAPFDLWDRERRQGIKLYVKRVFIMDDAEHLMPSYLRFVRGVIDSTDLPLNVSREILQQSKAIDSMRNASVKKVLGLLEKMAKNDAEKYTKFWGDFGKVIKEGPAEDSTNKDQLAKLLRFASTDKDTSEECVALADYISRMNEGQEKIYYIAADSFAAAKNSPHLEIFRKKGIEVLLLSDRVDEWLTSSLTEFDGKEMQSVTKGALDLGDATDEDEKKVQEQQAEELKGLVERVTASLGDKVKEVRLTYRLTNSPACLVSDENGMSANLERILQSSGQEVPKSQPIFELNPDHPLVKKIDNESDSKRFDDWTSILLDQALLSEGGQLEDPAAFTSRLNELLMEISG